MAHKNSARAARFAAALLFIHAGCHLGPPSFQKRAIFMRLLFTRHSKTVAASGLLFL